MKITLLSGYTSNSSDGKLFIALLTEKMVRMANTISPWGYTAKAAENIQQVA
jgi:hypothetical protein